MAINKEIIDELLSHYENPEDLLGEGGIYKELKKARWIQISSATPIDFASASRGVR